MDPKPTSIDCDHWPAPSADDYYTLKRYEAFEAAADYVAGALASHPAVIRVHEDFAFDSTDSLRPDRIRVLFERR